MEFRYDTSEDYHRGAAVIEEAVRKGPAVPYEIYLQQTVLKRRSETLSQVEAVTGLRFNVMKGDTGHVGGMANLNSVQVFIAEKFLDEDKRDLAIKIGAHEGNHMRTKIGSLEVEQELEKENPKYKEVLKKVLGKSDFGDTFLMEGFNELLTARDFGHNEKCKYNEAEVPAAEKLERLCKKLTGESLLKAFETGDKQLFFMRLKVLCEMLIIREKVDGALVN
jgi:hypothetical protein